MSPRLLGAAWAWAKAGVTGRWSRASSTPSGHGLPRYLGSVLTSWALYCDLEAWPAQGDPWVLGAGLGSCGICHPVHPSHTPSGLNG